MTPRPASSATTGVMRAGVTPSASATIIASSDGRYLPFTFSAMAVLRMTPSWSGSVLKKPNIEAAAAIGASGAEIEG